MVTDKAVAVPLRCAMQKLVASDQLMNVQINTTLDYATGSIVAFNSTSEVNRVDTCDLKDWDRRQKRRYLSWTDYSAGQGLDWIARRLGGSDSAVGSPASSRPQRHTTRCRRQRNRDQLAAASALPVPSSISVAVEASASVMSVAYEQLLQQRAQATAEYHLNMRSAGRDPAPPMPPHSRMALQDAASESSPHGDANLEDCADEYDSKSGLDGDETRMFAQQDDDEVQEGAGDGSDWLHPRINGVVIKDTYAWVATMLAESLTAASATSLEPLQFRVLDRSSSSGGRGRDLSGSNSSNTTEGFEVTVGILIPPDPAAVDVVGGDAGRGLGILASQYNVSLNILRLLNVSQTSGNLTLALAPFIAALAAATGENASVVVREVSLLAPYIVLPPPRTPSTTPSPPPPPPILTQTEATAISAAVPLAIIVAVLLGFEAYRRRWRRRQREKRLKLEMQRHGEMVGKSPDGNAGLLMRRPQSGGAILPMTTSSKAAVDFDPAVDTTSLSIMKRMSKNNKRPVAPAPTLTPTPAQGGSSDPDMNFRSGTFRRGHGASDVRGDEGGGEGGSIELGNYSGTNSAIYESPGTSPTAIDPAQLRSKLREAARSPSPPTAATASAGDEMMDGSEQPASLVPGVHLMIASRFIPGLGRIPSLPVLPATDAGLDASRTAIHVTTTDDRTTLHVKNARPATKTAALPPLQPSSASTAEVNSAESASPSPVHAPAAPAGGDPASAQRVHGWRTPAAASGTATPSRPAGSEATFASAEKRSRWGWGGGSSSTTSRRPSAAQVQPLPQQAAQAPDTATQRAKAALAAQLDSLASTVNRLDMLSPQIAAGAVGIIDDDIDSRSVGGSISAVPHGSALGPSPLGSRRPSVANGSLASQGFTVPSVQVSQQQQQGLPGSRSIPSTPGGGSAAATPSRARLLFNSLMGGSRNGINVGNQQPSNAALSPVSETRQPAGSVPGVGVAGPGALPVRAHSTLRLGVRANSGVQNTVPGNRLRGGTSGTASGWETGSDADDADTADGSSLESSAQSTPSARPPARARADQQPGASGPRAGIAMGQPGQPAPPLYQRPQQPLFMQQQLQRALQPGMAPRPPAGPPPAALQPYHQQQQQAALASSLQGYRSGGITRPPASARRSSAAPGSGNTGTAAGLSTGIHQQGLRVNPAMPPLPTQPMGSPASGPLTRRPPASAAASLGYFSRGIGNNNGSGVGDAASAVQGIYFGNSNPLLVRSATGSAYGALPGAAFRDSDESKRSLQSFGSGSWGSSARGTGTSTSPRRQMATSPGAHVPTAISSPPSLPPQLAVVASPNKPSASVAMPWFRRTPAAAATAPSAAATAAGRGSKSSQLQTIVADGSGGASADYDHATSQAAAMRAAAGGVGATSMSPTVPVANLSVYKSEVLKRNTSQSSDTAATRRTSTPRRKHALSRLSSAPDTDSEAEMM